MKALQLVGLLGMLLAASCGKVAVTTGDVPQPPGGSVASEATVALNESDLLQPGLSDYLLLHRTRPEGFPLHAMTGANICTQ